MAFFVLALIVLSVNGLLADDRIPMCQAQEGDIYLAPSRNIIATIPETNFTTVFVNYVNETFNIKCAKFDRSDKRQMRITFSSKEIGTGFSIDGPEVIEGLHPFDLSHKNAVNFINETIKCEIGDLAFCQVNFIVINQDPANCSVQTEKSNAAASARPDPSLECNVDDWMGQLGARRDSHIGFRGHGTPDFETTIQYSIYDATSAEWIYCTKVDEKGNAMEEKNSFAASTQGIRCPITFANQSEMPVLIRMETMMNSKISAGLPIFVKNKPKPDYTYFSVFLNNTIDYGGEPRVHPHDHTLSSGYITLIVVCCSAVVVVMAVLAIRTMKHHRISEKTPSTDVYTAGSDVEEGKSNLNSMETQRTVLYSDYRVIRDFAFLFEDDDTEEPEPDPQQALYRRLKIIKGQLQGDGSKINPNMELNTQAQNLPYNKALYEINRKNFRIGMQLGSGNYGSVYDGEAYGLFYPGSRTRVAVKTVNDAMDNGQLKALLYEIKIMSNLHFHLNLVNMVGACTSSDDETGADIWLLLEFCHRGNLKSFLINNRQQFINSITGQVATDLNSRLLLHWSHSIAKGMEYLESKRIMHGDLAARNILITDNYVAKVSDFGLSKRFYDNPQYRKKFRSEVPYKWMALEYLTDNFFSLKSDVWSFGIILWEMFSLGNEPYPTQSLEEIVASIRSGGRLAKPELMDQMYWAPQVYTDIMLPCWKADIKARIGFKAIVQILESMMFSDELSDYSSRANEYISMCELLLDDTTSAKRKVASNQSSVDLPPQGYNRVHSIDSMGDGPSAHQPISPSAQQEPPTADPMGYVTVDLIKSMSESTPRDGYVSVDTLKTNQRHASEPAGGYVTLQEAKDSAVSCGYVTAQELREVTQSDNGIETKRDTHDSGDTRDSGIERDQHDSGDTNNYDRFSEGSNESEPRERKISRMSDTSDYLPMDRGSLPAAPDLRKVAPEDIIEIALSDMRKESEQKV